MKPFVRFLKTGWLDLFFIVLLLWLLSCIVRLVCVSPADITQWLLVYLTGIYALFTLYLALIAVKSALATERSAAAAERSASAMEASTRESQLQRIAQFGAVFRFADFPRCHRRDDGSVVIRIQNPFGQPMIDFVAYLWMIERNARQEPEVRYSSMMESDPCSIMATDLYAEIVLSPTLRLESECRDLGEKALQRYMDVFSQMPEHALCVIMYNDRASIGIAPSVTVWDLQVVDSAFANASQTDAAFIKTFLDSQKRD